MGCLDTDLTEQRSALARGRCAGSSALHRCNSEIGGRERRRAGRARRGRIRLRSQPLRLPNRLPDTERASNANKPMAPTYVAVSHYAPETQRWIFPLSEILQEFLPHSEIQQEFLPNSEIQREIPRRARHTCSEQPGWLISQLAGPLCSEQPGQLDAKLTGDTTSGRVGVKSLWLCPEEAQDL